MSNPLNTQHIQLGNLQTTADVNALVKHLQNLYNNSIHVITGSGAPTSTPPKISSQYIDTTNKNVYVAVGNSHSTDWIKVS